MKLTPLAFALSSSFLLSTPLASHAAADEPVSTTGHNGSNTFTNGSFILIGGASYGVSGSDASNAPGDQNGEASNSIEGRSVHIVGTTVTGGPGGDAGNAGNADMGGAGGRAGFGGATVFGGISIAGNGGFGRYGSADGANAGGVSSNSVTLENVVLDGLQAKGGHGGRVGGYNGSDGSGGAGGGGGGSVFGGFSAGGGGGNSRANISHATGGNAGDVSNNTIQVLGSGHFIGGEGGPGGYLYGYDGAGGDGGYGGASIFGGVTTGGNGGATSGSTVVAGNAGNADGNEIALENITLEGGLGGAGGYATYEGNSRNGGSGGTGGHGGGSVFGGISMGGNAGSGSQATGGSAGSTSHNTITILGTSSLTGAEGGKGGNTADDLINGSSWGSGGSGGHGGASIFGGLSLGGQGGTGHNSGGDGSGGGAGASSFNTLTLEHISLDGSAANGGNGGALAGDPSSGWGGSGGGSAGYGGFGGGSVFGGVSQGGNGGAGSSADGGTASAASDNTITITGASHLLGGAGGVGGVNLSQPGGSSGAGGHGGGSVFGGVSTGGQAGFASTLSANGGTAGDASNNTISISTTTLTGGDGGDGGALSLGIADSGGLGGGSVFGGLSIGGTGGYSNSQALGGSAGAASNNSISLNSVTLLAGTAGDGGVSQNGQNGMDGLLGGSVFGGVSLGGNGGYVNGSGTANGGNAGDASYNTILINGDSHIDGDIYGGYSRGGAQGIASNATGGTGGAANNNSITLIGEDIKINGHIYGGLSIDNGINIKQDLLFNGIYQGNTLSIRSGHIEVKGINNFEKYNWLLPKDEFDGDKIVIIDPINGTPVNLNNTIHKVDVEAEGNTLQAGDQVILIDRVTGSPQILNRNLIEQGFFIVYDAEMAVEPNKSVTGTNQLVLNVLGVQDGSPDGKINPESEAFLKGRIAQLAMVDQGADMISDGIWSARASLRERNSNLFIVVDGGSNRYKTGNNGHLKLNDLKFAVGAAKAFTLNDQSIGMAGVFAEHGNGNYSSYDDLGTFGEVRANGNTHYNGAGALFHVDVANTDVSKVQDKPNIFDSKYGLYVHGALRFGHAKVDFRSADLVNGDGVEGSYRTKSRYVTAMVGAGYVLTLDEKKAVDFYGRYTFSRLNGKEVQVVDEKMSVGAAHSDRLRLGARFGYAYSDKVTPYAGLAYEKNFSGDVSGSAYGFSIKEKSLKGSTGIVEAGVLVKPKGSADPLSLNFSIQGYGGQRKGVTAAIRARYVF